MTDESMTTMSHWEQLPFELKADIVNRVDYGTKCAIRRCSKSHKQIIDKIPLKIGKALMSISRSSIRLQVDEEFNEPSNYREMKTAIQAFVRLFRHPKSEFGEVTIQNLEGLDNDRIIQFNRLLKNGLQTLSSSQRILAESFYYGIPGDQEGFLSVLRVFRPGYLKHIRMKALALNELEWLSITATDHWKLANSVRIEVENPVPFSALLHFETFHVVVAALRANDAVRVIEDFINTKRPKDSYFYILSGVEIDNANILVMGKPADKNISVQSPWKPDVITQTNLYQLGDGFVLYVVFMKNELTGKICHSDTLQDDCREFYSKYFPGY